MFWPALQDKPDPGITSFFCSMRSSMLTLTILYALACPKENISLLMGNHWFCSVMLTEVIESNIQAPCGNEDCDGLRAIFEPGRGNAGGPQAPPVGPCMPDQNGRHFRGRLIGAWWPKSGSKSSNKLWSLPNLCYLSSSYWVKTSKWRAWPRQCQMSARVCIPRNVAQPARKHGVFRNVPAQAFRISAISIRFPELCSRQSVEKDHSFWITRYSCWITR